MIKIINLKNNKEECFKIDRSSIFGNPFIIGKDGNRDEVIDKYKKYFLNRIKEDLHFRFCVKQLIDYAEDNDLVLGCWCYPKKCHGDIIKEFIERQTRIKKELI